MHSTGGFSNCTTSSHVNRGQLAVLKSEREPITVQFNRFAATRYRFEREGIRYVEVKTLHCPEEHKDQARWSQALTWVDRPN